MANALPQSGESNVERRGYLRFEVHLDKLEVTVGVLGFVEPTAGAVLNVSRGGMNVCLEREIPTPLVGYYCLVRFVEADGRVNPEAMLGKLRRMEADRQYAIEFASPLEVLNMGSDPETLESGSERQATPTDEPEHLIR